MSNTQKNALYSLALLIFFLGVYYYRQYTQPTLPPQMYVEGQTMGTSYHIKYLDAQKRDFKASIDSLLLVFNRSLSTYDSTSEISRFNRDSLFRFQLPFFYPVLRRSAEIFRLSEGAFDPTVAGLVNYWGFGFKNFKTRQPDSTAIDSLRQWVGFDKMIVFDAKQIRKTKHGVMLDFNAIAQGYGTDVVADFLRQRGINHYMVEIGGEVACRGTNREGKVWTIGINNPQQETALKAVVALKDRALATSGNYRKFYVKDGKKYAHTLNPKTGFPVQHSLLSASVFAPDAMTADAMATVFMVVGLERAKEILKTQTNLDAYLIYADAQGVLHTWASEGIAKAIEENNVASK